MVHIPKTGGEYAIGRLLRLAIHTQLKFEVPNVQRPCNQGVGLLSHFETRFSRNFTNRTCNMWMTEQPIIPRTTEQNPILPYNHTYVMIRKPSEHVLSQFFHCKESTDHAKYRDFMPSLDEWLDFHVSRVEESTRKGEDLPVRVREMKTHKGRMPFFHCYDPIDVQSYYTNFYNSTSEDELKERFDLVGDFDMVGKSICAIAIRYMGYVPPMCDCTNTNKGRRLISNDHGTKHHGSTFVLTDEQKAKVDKLTRLDHLLYRKAKHVFQAHVKEIEEELSIELCDDPDLSTELDSMKSKKLTKIMTHDSTREWSAKLGGYIT